MAALLCLSCLRTEEEEVTELDYRHCSLDDVPNEIFAYERTLETLRLDCNNVRDLPRCVQIYIYTTLKGLNNCPSQELAIKTVRRESV